jgi:hypothetical protein
MFIRMPTDTPVKAGMLVDIVRRMIENQSESDAETAETLRLLDVARRPTSGRCCWATC